MIYRQVSVKWPKWIAVEISSCLGRSCSACRQAAATKLGVGMARASAQVLPLSVLSYLVVGRRVTPMIYRQVSVKWPKWIAVEISSCLGRSGSACRQPAATKLGVGKLQPPNLAWTWPEHRSRCCRCPFHRIFSCTGASHQWSTAKYKQRIKPGWRRSYNFVQNAFFRLSPSTQSEKTPWESNFATSVSYHHFGCAFPSSA